MKYSIYLIACLTMLFISQCTNSKNESSVNIEQLLQELTLEEKVQMIHASSSFTSGGVERLGIPELSMSDGPHGVRLEHGRDWEADEGVEDSSTYLPVGTALAATWNADLGYRFGEVLGKEAAYRGKDIILGPGLNIIRDPLNGRNFEYMTEDPYLNARMTVQYIKGVQDQGIAACAKHYIANSLEYMRDQVNVEMSDRALHEIYLPGFKAAVQEGKVLSIMSAYNKFRGVYCSHSNFLLDEILRDQLGYDGIVISDWNAVKETKGAATAGLDIEMGTDLTMLGQDTIDYNDFHLGTPLLDMVKNGEVDEKHIDAKVRNILSVMDRIHKFDGKRPEGVYNAPEHQQTARDIAEEAIVLLKNEEDFLPLAASSIKNIAVIGANATHKQAGGGGSSQVKAYYEVTPLEALQSQYGNTHTIRYSEGYTVGRESNVTKEQIREATQAATSSDVVFYFGGLIHGYTDSWNDNAFDAEDVDKADLKLPFGQDILLEAILKANPNTVIILFGGGPVDMSKWIEQSKALLYAWYPGMEGGNALTDILFGKVNPSGKLPMTFPYTLEASPAHAFETYPDENLLIDHKEDIYVGYRYFDSFDVEPLFPFGYGLSYTDFTYSDMMIEKQGNDRVKVSMQLSNEGEHMGKEIIQLYVRDIESTLVRPAKELKAFKKIELNRGESQTVTFELDANAFEYYDDKAGKWVLEAGEFEILIGSSSRDIRLTEMVKLL